MLTPEETDWVELMAEKAHAEWKCKMAEIAVPFILAAIIMVAHAF